MSERSSDIPEQVRKLAPKDRPADDPTDDAGRAPDRLAAAAG
jgi:hypothetical protein